MQVQDQWSVFRNGVCTCGSSYRKCTYDKGQKEREKLTKVLESCKCNRTREHVQVQGWLAYREGLCTCG